MPTIGATVDAESKKRFTDVARTRNLTPSQLVGNLIAEFLKREHDRGSTRAGSRTHQSKAMGDRNGRRPPRCHAGPVRKRRQAACWR